MNITQTPYTILMLMTATPAWLGLSREDRDAFNENVVEPLLGRYADKHAEGHTARSASSN